jgi:hypothetical protein
MHHFKISDIKFIKDKDKPVDEHWTDLYYNKHLIKYGIVCNYAMDRCDDMDSFVIIDYYTKDNKEFIKVIYPRTRIIDGKVYIGQDKSADNPNSKYRNHKSNCQIKNINKGRDFYCICGESRRYQQEYKETFIPVDEGDYRTYEINLDGNGWYISYTYLSNDKGNTRARDYIQNINDMDMPCFFNNIYTMKITDNDKIDINLN